MMWFERFLDENTIYWAPPTKSGTGDGYIWPVPIDLLGRWQYNLKGSGEKAFYSGMGTSLLERTTVWLSQDVKPDGYLRIGLVADLAVGFVPDNTGDALKIATTQAVRSLSYDNHIYKVFLDEG